MHVFMDERFLGESLKNVTFGRFLIENDMKNTRVGWIIHLFALLHAVVALACKVAGVEDEILLTILTMTMTLLICMRRGFSAEFTASSIILVNIIGYLLGNAGAVIFSHIIGPDIFINALSTAITTEILGWSIMAFSRMLHPEKSIEMSSRFLKWIILAMGTAFSLRVCIILLVSSTLFNSASLMAAATRVISSSISLVTMLCLNILYIRYAGKHESKVPHSWKIPIFLAFILITAFIGACLSCVGISFNITVNSWVEFIQIAIMALIAQVTMYCVVFMVNYAISAGSRVQEEKEKKHVAQYRYQMLKRQVDPHFLFNSLNVLDCLVWEASKEQASTYIHKLAGIYRYMIRSEEDELVQLRDELTFVEMYVDLLKVRFPEGFDMIADIREEDKARFVLPCSIQLLIENATKHNAVGTDNPLVIHVESDGTQVRVSNNIVPKVTRVQSTGMGHKYIRKQYLDISGKEIKIEKTETEFTVTLPLL